eukprot:CAMPEP_0168338524 /NCGR_PEP_ID=MMETSP0213-20121227/12897_1 /TAXON_ID=151035 /ORGANISM="Euplotes harpa, Strain FSP1.4" /LENGTH=35 /DNA_ID= /DNA_START= /DNA_END= /DNA_ORIENTATION=
MTNRKENFLFASKEEFLTNFYKKSVGDSQLEYSLV